VNQAIDPLADRLWRRHLRGRSDPSDPDRAGQLQVDSGGLERYGITRGKRFVN
jgi:hypothetical protein